jgi:hypothetical protein
VAGEQPLTGSWDNPEGPALFQRTWTADGRAFIYYGKGATTPSLVGRYTIEKKWTDEEGRRWYHAVEHRSPPPYREGISCTRYCVIRIDPTGTRLECCASPYGYSGMLTLGDYPVFYQEKQVFYRQAPRKL